MTNDLMLAERVKDIPDTQRCKYFANPIGKRGSRLRRRVESLMRSGVIGFIDTPDQWGEPVRNVHWCADNGCFGKNYEESKWWAWLQANAPAAGQCEFANAPDVVHLQPDPHGRLDKDGSVKMVPVGDAAATLIRSRPWLARIRALGYKVGYVAQDGFDPTVVPWDDFDVLFLGGSDDFKVGPLGLRLDGTPRGEVPAALAAKEALACGKRVHMGRVNSRKRFRFAARIGCTSVDGTCLTFNFEAGLDNLLDWTDENTAA